MKTSSLRSWLRSLIRAGAELAGLSAQGFEIAPQSVATFASHDGEHYLVATEIFAVPSALDVQARLFDGMGQALGSAINLGVGAAVKTACDGVRHLVTWEDGSSGSGETAWKLVGRFCGLDGSPASAQFELCTLGVYVDGMRYLVYGGGVYLAAYTWLVDPARGSAYDNRFV